MKTDSTTRTAWHRRSGLAVAALLILLPTLVFAQTGPASSERELSTDRPDKTESPYTVPDGRFQIEMDGATYVHDRNADARVETIGVTPFNLKLGLGTDTDLQVVVAPYVHRTSTDRRDGTRTTADGFGDVTIRLKYNLRGNDGGTTALALMPFVTLPTSRAGLGATTLEFGLIAPLAIALSENLGLGLMTEVDVIGDTDGRGRQVSFVNSATLGVSLADRLGLYVELFTERSDAWIVTGDLGITYAIADNIQLDTGINLGLTRPADDMALFFGLSRRF